MRPMPGKMILLLCAAALVAALVGCGLVSQSEPVRVWTPAPVTMPPRPTQGPAVSPVATEPPSAPPTATPTRSTSVEPTARPTTTAVRPTALPTRAPVSSPGPSATPDRSLVVIREADIEGAVAAGAGAQSGLTLTGLQVRFTAGKMRLTADRLGYGPIQVEGLVLVGRLVAQGGILRFEAESISPRTLATSLIPTLANQALTQYASQWYVEDVRILEGRMELRVR